MFKHLRGHKKILYNISPPKREMEDIKMVACKWHILTSCVYILCTCILYICVKIFAYLIPFCFLVGNFAGHYDCSWKVRETYSEKENRMYGGKGKQKEKQR